MRVVKINNPFDYAIMKVNLTEQHFPNPISFRPDTPSKKEREAVM